jgi:hypothetical protein
VVHGIIYALLFWELGTLTQKRTGKTYQHSFLLSIKQSTISPKKEKKIAFGSIDKRKRS